MNQASPPQSSTWDDDKWQRYGLLAGVVFVVLNLVSFFAPGTPPARDASAKKIAEFFVDNADGIKLAGIVFGFALLFGAWWVGSLWRVIGRLEPSGPRLALIAVVGFTVSGALAGVGQGLFTAPALRPEELAGSTELVWSLVYVLFGLSLAGIAAFSLALGALALWTKFVPPWLGWLAMLSGLASAIAIVSSGTEAGAFAVIQLVAYLSWLAWVLLASVVLYRKQA